MDKIKRKLRRLNPDNLLDDVSNLENTLVNAGYLNSGDKLVTEYNDEYLEIEVNKVDDQLAQILQTYNLLEYFDSIEDSPKVESQNSNIYIIYIQGDVYKDATINRTQLESFAEETTKNEGKLLLVTRDKKLFDEYKKQDKNTIRKFKFIRKDE